MAKPQNSAPRKKPGPEPKPIDVHLIKELAKIQCTHEEMAAVVGLKRRHFIERVQNSQELRDVIDSGWDEGRASIRRQQFKMLLAGDKTMAVWLGKQYLGQRDQVGIGDPEGKPLEPMHVIVEYEDRPTEAPKAP